MAAPIGQRGFAARRRVRDEEGDRSHIPREERPYREYHPALRTHLALALIRQNPGVARHHHRSHSQANGSGAWSNSTGATPGVTTPNLTNGGATYANGAFASDFTASRRGDRDVTPSDASEFADGYAGGVSRDDLVAWSQIAQPGKYDDGVPLEPVFVPAVETPEEAAAKESKKARANGTTDDPTSRITIDPALTDQSLLDPTLYEDSAAAAQQIVPEPQHSRRQSVTVAKSDRFLRSEVSAEEKYERLRHEQGFSMGELKKPSFRKLDASEKERAATKLTGNAIAFGYQADRPFVRPEHAYIRSVNLPEAELIDRVEYDMDDQDEIWLQSYNESRAVSDADPISPEVFEITITKIEKEWTALEKRLPRPEQSDEEEADDTDDAKCAICDDGECENTNAIVFCDGCNIAVHQECYGVPYIPEGQWLCRKCFASPHDPVSCLFCPSNAGAFKQTSDLHWAHLQCANWIPEVTVGNPVFQEPVEGVALIPPSRWKLTCYICRLRVGACIQCHNKTCYTSFHASCARRAKLLMQYDRRENAPTGKAYCDKHCPDWYVEHVDLDNALKEAQQYFHSQEYLEDEASSGGLTRKRGKQASSAKRLKQSAVIPASVFTDIKLYMQKFRVKFKDQYLADMCKYWSLKRRARKGASLLKRLQLQVEDTVAHRLDDETRARRIEFGKSLLTELENGIKALLDDMYERETMRLDANEMRDDLINLLYMPLQPVLRDAIAELRTVDPHGLLEAAQIAIELLPSSGGRTTWGIVSDKLDRAQYGTVAQFELDMQSLLRNMLEAYPDASSKEVRTILKLQEKLPLVLAKATEAETSLNIDAGSLIAKCFDQEFEPQGLSILELEPWVEPSTVAGSSAIASRSVSPAVVQKESPVASLRSTRHSSLSVAKKQSAPGAGAVKVIRDEASTPKPTSTRARRSEVGKEVHEEATPTRSTRSAAPPRSTEPSSSTPAPSSSGHKKCTNCKRKGTACDGSEPGCAFAQETSISASVCAAAPVPTTEAMSTPPRTTRRRGDTIGSVASTIKSEAGVSASPSARSSSRRTRRSHGAAPSVEAEARAIADQALSHQETDAMRLPSSAGRTRERRSVASAVKLEPNAVATPLSVGRLSRSAARTSVSKQEPAPSPMPISVGPKSSVPAKRSLLSDTPRRSSLASAASAAGSPAVATGGRSSTRASAAAAASAATATGSGRERGTPSKFESESPLSVRLRLRGTASLNSTPTTPRTVPRDDEPVGESLGDSGRLRKRARR